MYYLVREFFIDPLSFTRIYYEFNIFRANLLWIHYLCSESSMTVLSFSRNHFELIIYTIYSTMHFAILLWTYFLARDFTMKSLFFFANSVWNNYLSCEYTMNSLSLSRNYSESIIFSRLQYELYIFLANIYKFTINSPSCFYKL